MKTKEEEVLIVVFLGSVTVLIGSFAFLAVEYFMMLKTLLVG